MDPLPVPEWIRNAPDVITVQDWHLPEGSGISGPPAGAYLTEEAAENALRPLPMWHVLFEVTDEDIDQLRQTHLLVMAVSVVPIFMVGPAPFTIDGERHD